MKINFLKMNKISEIVATIAVLVFISISASLNGKIKAGELSRLMTEERKEASTSRVPIEVNHPASTKSNCVLQKEGEGPIPVILMSLGRSGSSITWDTMSALTGHRNKAYEYTGNTASKSDRFFNALETNEAVGYDWAIKKLCIIQHRPKNISTNTGIIGFQWKPYINSFNRAYAREGLREIAKHRHPAIRIVYLTRNHLDRRISNLRHDHSKQGSHAIAAHCAVGDQACIKEHSQFEANITFPIGKDLLSWLRGSHANDRRVRKRLQDLNVDHIHISYEKLFTSGNADEWMRVFSFLGVGPSENLTMEEVRSSFSMASTHSKSRNETISNYEDVRNTLVGTEFEYLLAE